MTAAERKAIEEAVRCLVATIPGGEEGMRARVRLTARINKGIWPPPPVAQQELIEAAVRAAHAEGWAQARRQHVADLAEQAALEHDR